MVLSERGVRRALADAPDSGCGKVSDGDAEKVAEKIVDIERPAQNDLQRLKDKGHAESKCKNVLPIDAPRHKGEKEAERQEHEDVAEQHLLHPAPERQLAAQALQQRGR